MTGVSEKVKIYNRKKSASAKSTEIYKRKKTL